MTRERVPLRHANDEAGGSVNTGWVRLSRKCNNRCVFCSDAEQLDGSIVPWAEVEAEIDALAGAGASRVVFTGGESTLSKHLLSAIKRATALGLSAELVTNGRIIQSDKIASMLEKAGLKVIHISLHAGRRQTHDTLTQANKSWVETLQAVKSMGRTGVRVNIRSVLTRQTSSELAYLMHLVMMGGAKGFQVRAIEAVGRAPEYAGELQIGGAAAIRTIGKLWYEAKEETVLFDVVGYDHSIDLGLEPEEGPAQADRALMNLLRKRVQIHNAVAGTQLLDVVDMARDFTNLVHQEGSLHAAGLELLARSAPLTDAPPCVGGIPTVTRDHWGEQARWGELCAGCPEQQRCPGMPRKLAKVTGDSLAPLPTWSGVALGSRAVVLGGSDELLREQTLPELAEALTARGLVASYGDVDAVLDADLVICGDAGTARFVLELPNRPPNQRVELLDAAGGQGADELSAWPLVIRSDQPGRVGALVNAGHDLRRVRWLPYPVPAAARFAPGVHTRPVEARGMVVIASEVTDWDTLMPALLRTRKIAPRATIFLSRGAESPGALEGTTMVVDAPDEEVLAAIHQARVVVVAPHCVPEDDGPRGATLAGDLRWTSVAQAAGRPVVAVRGPAVEDHLRQDRSAMMVPPGDPAALSEAIRRVCNEPLRLKRLHEGALEVSRAASVDHWADLLVQGQRATQPDQLMPTTVRPWPVW